MHVLGRGNEVVVLAHGFGTDQSVWKHLLPQLTDSYRLVIFDNMGAGTTDLDFYDFERYLTLNEYVLDLLSILEELHIESCIYLGHSISGMVGCLAFVQRPDLFTKLILLSASPR